MTASPGRYTYLVHIVMQAAITKCSRPLVALTPPPTFSRGLARNLTRQGSQSSLPKFREQVSGPPTLQPSTTFLPLLRNRPFEQLSLRKSQFPHTRHVVRTFLQNSIPCSGAEGAKLVTTAPRGSSRSIRRLCAYRGLSLAPAHSPKGCPEQTHSPPCPRHSEKVPNYSLNRRTCSLSYEPPLPPLRSFPSTWPQQGFDFDPTGETLPNTRWAQSRGTKIKISDHAIGTTAETDT